MSRKDFRRFADFKENKCVNYNNIYKELASLSRWFLYVASCLNKYLFKSLREEYDYLITDEAVKETIEVNEYQFTKDGKLATRLLQLTEETED